MAAVQYVHYPHYRALILRKTYADLSLPGRDHGPCDGSWWDGVEGARFSHADKTCYFPSGASVTFGYLWPASATTCGTKAPNCISLALMRRARYQAGSSNISTLASAKPSAIPFLCVIGWLAIPATCPTTGSRPPTLEGADGHNLVYLPGLMTDNPGLDVGEYRKQLAHLDPVTRKQLGGGGLGCAVVRWRAGRVKAQIL